MAILGRFTPLVEQVSIDEAFLDVAGTRGRSIGSPGDDRARGSASAVRDEVGLTRAVGVATTKLVAKVASDLRKPDGLVVVPPGSEAGFLAPLPIGGCGASGEQTRGRARRLSASGRSATSPTLPGDLLVRRFGKHGAVLAERARGIDPSPVTGGDAAKSVSHEHTFDVDTADRR